MVLYVDSSQKVETVFKQDDESDDDEPKEENKFPERALWSVEILDQKTLDVLAIGCEGTISRIQTQNSKIVWKRTLSKSFFSS